MTRQDQTLRYFCTGCNRTFEKSIVHGGSALECPVCSRELGRPALPPVQFQTAYDIRSNLGFDIERIDRFLNLTVGDRVCIAGKCANMLVSRLCVRTLVSERHTTAPVVVIDAGNSSDVYQCVDFARQYGLDTGLMLRQITVSRAFTVHQLAWLATRELDRVVRQDGARVAVISDLTKMFVQDPQVDRLEADRLIGEIAEATWLLPASVLVVVSLHQSSQYDATIMPQFKKRVEILEKPGGLRAELHSCGRSCEAQVSTRDMLLVRGE